MASEVVTTDQNEVTSPYSQEVEFVLIIARMIKTLKEDPAELRRAAYEIARAKLRDVSSAEEQENGRLLASLETAIRGVEKFSRQSDHHERPGLADQSGQTARRDYSGGVALRPTVEIHQFADPVDDISTSRLSGTRLAPTTGRQSLLVSMLVSITFGVFLAGAAFSFVLYNGHSVGPQALVSAPPPVPTRPPSNPLPFPVPAAYGVYALDNGTLIELDSLSEHVPDRRIAISTPINKPSHTILRDSHIKFVVFRRDLAALAPERVDVRVVAKVMRALTFNANGKPGFAKVDDAWNIRNVFHEFRVQPIPGNPEMLLMQPEKADFELPPGRYVLVLRNQGYDFTIPGETKDPVHCLERTEAANGIFYSDCGKK
jgi:hypothetical protein